ncbi:MAG: UDP-N-acetylmuramate dehydrogenase [Clostridia bacterium]|nr:UDP-N-acetylmuramate dehydrogenase [Clostridia bacterium]
MAHDYKALCAFAQTLGCEAAAGVPFAEFTTFRTGGPCGALITAPGPDALKALLAALKERAIPFLFLGNGSNVLAPDEGLDCAVLRLGDDEPRLADDGKVFCGAGTKLITLCRFALEHGLSGMEFAYGIPGSVGGAAFMNGGAYGGEMKDVVTRVFHLTPDGEEGSLTNEEAKFNYRDSAYRTNGCIITGVEFQLTPADPADIKAKMDDLLGRRKAKQPLEYPSAGSTFKRPDATHFAGALIEQCGLKGFSVGGAEVSEKHAGFIINKQGATSADVTALIREVQRRVKEQTGVELEPEVILLR